MNKKLKEALEPFASIKFSDGVPDRQYFKLVPVEARIPDSDEICAGDFRRACEVLAAITSEQAERMDIAAQIVDALTYSKGPARGEKIELVNSILCCSVTAAEGEEPHTRPHPRWKPSNGYERHPQTAEEWDYRKDPTGPEAKARSERRLNVAGDYDDPRAPEQMALVLRIDLLRLIGELNHKRAFFEAYRARVGAPATPWETDCWRPFWTAPKDGSLIEVNVFGGPAVCVWWMISATKGAGFYVAGFDGQLLTWEPTHWRPAQEKPQEIDHGNEDRSA